MKRSRTTARAFGLAAALAAAAACSRQPRGDPPDPHAAHAAQAAHAGHEGHEGHAAHAASGAAPAPANVPSRLPDVALVSQDGAPVRFPADLAGDGVVIMDFVFTNCSTVCPVLSALFWSVQESLGERLGRDVRLVSVTVDPARDTPAALKAYAERLGAKPGWTWLTGEQEQVERLLKAMGVWTAEPAAHTPVVMVGDLRGGTWVRLNGFPSREQILQAVERVSEARAKATPVRAEGRP